MKRSYLNSTDLYSGNFVNAITSTVKVVNTVLILIENFRRGAARFFTREDLLAIRFRQLCIICVTKRFGWVKLWELAQVTVGSANSWLRVLAHAQKYTNRHAWVCP